MKIAIINGPNLNLLGKREPDIYGNESMDKIIENLRNEYPSVDFTYFQSNNEGVLIDKIQEIGFVFDGVVVRCIAVDVNGNKIVVVGMLYILAKRLKSR